MCIQVMANWGANHGVTIHGHVGADMITMASMLRIPVTMHNVPRRKGLQTSFVVGILEQRTQRLRLYGLQEVRSDAIEKSDTKKCTTDRQAYLP